MLIVKVTFLNIDQKECINEKNTNKTITSPKKIFIEKTMENLLERMCVGIECVFA